MQREQLTRPGLLLIGKQVRTGYRNESRPETGQIGPCVMDYFHNGTAEQIPHRSDPGVTLCAYTDYASDEYGDYTYFIGEEVSSLDEVPEGLSSLIIPEQTYVKFTAGPGPMPAVVKDAWEAIWKMSTDELGGHRRYLADFELYDERAADHARVVFDLYIGIDA